LEEDSVMATRARDRSWLPRLRWIGATLAVVASLAVTLGLKQPWNGRVGDVQRGWPKPGAEDGGALLRAAFEGDVATVEHFLRRKVSTEVSGANGETPLMLAALRGHDAVIEVLLAQRAVVNATDTHGFTALSYAAGAGNATGVTILLRGGAVASVDAHPGEPALVYAARTGDVALTEALLAHCQRLQNLPLQQALDRGVEAGSSGVVAALSAYGATPIPIYGGANALDSAVRHGHTDVAEVLVAAHGTDLLAAADRDLLTLAVDGGHRSVLEALLAAGADPDMRSEGAESAIERAADRGDVEAVSLLLDYCADPGGAFARAAVHGDRSTIEVLLSHGVDAGPAPEGAEAPLAAAYREQDLAYAARLLANGAAPATRGPLGQPLLASAIVSGRLDFAALLLEHGADPNMQLSAPFSKEFIGAVPEGKSLQFFLRRDTRFTPLMLAAGTAGHDAIKLLLRHGASTNRTTKNYKRYPISFAAAHGDIYAQQLILGQDPPAQAPGERRKVVIDLSEQRATLFRGGEAVLSSEVSTGKEGYRTPTGEYVISNKHKSWTSTLYHVPMPYYMRLSCSAFGMHVGNLPGYPASHGCIRMPRKNAIAFFQATRLGDPVSIIP
jgi:ankyrin repeat protein